MLYRMLRLLRIFLCSHAFQLRTFNLVLLKLSADRELRLILKENSLGVDKQQMLSMYKYATREKFVPFIIDIEITDDNQKSRKGFLEYLKNSGRI